MEEVLSIFGRKLEDITGAGRPSVLRVNDLLLFQHLPNFANMVGIFVLHQNDLEPKQIIIMMPLQYQFDLLCDPLVSGRETRKLHLNDQYKVPNIKQLL